MPPLYIYDALRVRMTFITRELEKLYGKEKITDVTDREIVAFFKMMRDGRIRKKDGTTFWSVPDYAKVFQAFWHWYQRVQNEKGNTVRDITRYIDVTPMKESVFAYFTIDELRKMGEQAKYEYKVLMWFLFDSGLRPPTELANIRVSDLSKLEGSDDYQLHIREEISKTFGRKIKLLLCSRWIRDWIIDRKLGEDDCLFHITPRIVNQYLKRLAVKALGARKTKGGKLTENLTMYDFRHSSACYWLPRYKSESALKYRFGWKKNGMIHHYTKLLGMRDTIAEDDLMVDSDAQTRLEKELETERRTRNILQEQIQAQRDEMADIRGQLEKSQRRDDFILRVLKSMDRQGGMKEMVKTVKQEGLVEELARLG